MTNILKKPRFFYFDVLRVIAALMVIMIHTSGPYSIKLEHGFTDFVIGNLLNGFSRVGVPIFVMLSGALMLEESKQYTVGEFLKKYVLNLSIITVAWGCLFAVISSILLPLVKSQPIAFSEIFDTLLNGGYHMWYLYLAIGLYLVTPILKMFVKKDNKDYIFYLILVLVCVGFVGNTISVFKSEYIQSMVAFFNGFRLTGFGYIAYFLIGWYLANFDLERKKRIAFYCLGLVGVTYTIVTHMLSVQGTLLEGAYENISLNILFSAIALFLFVKQLFNGKKNLKLSKLFSFISKHTFGVYLIHTLVLAILFKIIPISVFSLARISIIWVLATAISFLITFIISKIPFLKYFVRG